MMLLASEPGDVAEGPIALKPAPVEIEHGHSDRSVLERALESFPVAVRTLDALHLATIEYARGQGQAVKLASFDIRMTPVWACCHPLSFGTPSDRIWAAVGEPRASVITNGNLNNQRMKNPRPARSGSAMLSHSRVAVTALSR